MTINNDNLEYYLDRFPVSETELQYALAKQEQPREIDDYCLPVVLLATTQAAVFEYGDDSTLQYLEAVMRLSGRRGADKLWQALHGYSHKRNELSHVLYWLCTNKKDDLPPSWKAMFRSLPEKCTLVQFQHWCNQNIPKAAPLIGNLHAVYYLNVKPITISPSLSDTSLILNSDLKLKLGLLDISGPYKPLYRSELDGLHFRTFETALQNYCGPTLILILTKENEVFGYFSEIPWKISSWFTNDDADGSGAESFLFRLSPSWNVYRPFFDVNQEPWKKVYHQFLKLPNHLKKNGLTGLAVDGVGIDTPRLHLNQSLERCEASSYGSYFENGALLSNPDDHFFDVEMLEVWAVRSSEKEYESAVEVGRQRADIQESNRIKLATVDKKAFVEDFASGAYCNKVFAHRNQLQGDAEVDF